MVGVGWRSCDGVYGVRCSHNHDVGSSKMMGIHIGVKDPCSV